MKALATLDLGDRNEASTDNPDPAAHKAPSEVLLGLKSTSAEADVLKWDLNRPARAALKVAQAEVPKGPSPGLQPTPESSPAKGDTCPGWWAATGRPSRA